MWSFYKGLLKGYQNIGAFAPSSSFLANAIAQTLPSPFIGQLIELGPGTGAITKSLVKSNINPQQIIAVEYSDDFFKHMKKQFPQICTLKGSAEELSQLIKAEHKPINAIVSSLPLRSFPDQVVTKILNEIDQVLSKGGYYIQFTYFKKASPIKSLKNYNQLSSKRVLLNLPPARVDVFKKH